MVSRPGSPLVLFCAAAGPQRGFGHLVRCGVLADALGVRREMALRGSLRTVPAAVRLGWTVHRGGSRRLLFQLAPDLVLVDDPSPRHVALWVREARRLGIAVATVHDLGLARVDSDLAIDGSVAQARGVRRADLEGPAFAILDPAIATLRSRPPAREARRVLIALGGGANARAVGVQLARRISRAVPDAVIRIAAGFQTGGATPGTLPPRCQWLDAPAGLAHALATSSVAVVAGGVTLYEAAALGTPVVALAIVAAQRPSVRAFAKAGAAIEATGPIGTSRSARRRGMDRAAALVAVLLADPAGRRSMSRRARGLVDGQGTARAVRRLLTLLAGSSTEEVRHVA